MRFVPKQAKEGINVSDTHPLVEAGTLIVGLSAIFFFVALALIFIVELALFYVSSEDEADWFSDWLPDDLVTVAPNDERLYETQLLVDRLAEHWPDSAYSFRVEIDDSDVSNAMALPGGLIIVTQGLLNRVESENELAFVLGHELGHFKNRDHLRALGRGLMFSIVFAGVMGNDVTDVGINIADVTLKGFSRQQELDADEFGLSIVHEEYGHVDEAWRLFERWDDDDESTIEIINYLSTHPETGDRIVDMKRYAESQGWRIDGEIRPLSW